LEEDRLILEKGDELEGFEVALLFFLFLFVRRVCFLNSLTHHPLDLVILLLAFFVIEVIEGGVGRFLEVTGHFVMKLIIFR
jgi:hypothetical protein